MSVQAQIIVIRVKVFPVIDVVRRRHVVRGLSLDARHGSCGRYGVARLVTNLDSVIVIFQYLFGVNSLGFAGTHSELISKRLLKTSLW